ncbi:hypothetical protein QTP81_01600 [Alteromonas sp. ASW11-36]|uniref:3-phosphoshikimate 1-carboxyvinyltransferase n=1 Tax=Alteromonas arenosi TaxID=3055817 RepID=A0ABT7SSY4_9ALTE|nr:hypothetical protein [Alteromonas sp. ASW11-36]MDM7859298.1 hypothetical protein [Alteromonas sp. ASW11-36]
MSTQNPATDPVVMRFVNAMPEQIANSLTLEQLVGIQHALTRRDANKHTVDVRLTLKLPFVPSSFYLVLLGGKNRRQISERERWFAGLLLLLLITGVITFVIFVGIIALYLLKSALGIDLFPDSSTGIWDWFNPS